MVLLVSGFIVGSSTFFCMFIGFSVILVEYFVVLFLYFCVPFRNFT